MFKKLEATTVLMIINIFMFIVIAVQGPTTNALISTGGVYAPYVTGLHQYWRFMTAMFLHASAITVVSNMVALYFVGRLLEPLFEKERFLGLYLLSGVMGNIVSFALSPSDSIIVGANSALFGLFTALVLTSYLLPQHTGLQQLKTQTIGMMILTLSLGSHSGIDLYGHLGGFIGGVFAYFLLGYFKHDRNRQIMLFLIYVIACVGMYYMGYSTMMMR